MEELHPPSLATSSTAETRADSPLPPSRALPLPYPAPTIEGYDFAPDPVPWAQRAWTYQLRPFRGIWADLTRRAPFYVDDWREGFRRRNWERVTASTVRMYFLNLFPALAYILDMRDRTGGAYGINEGLLASALPALVFSTLSAQPITLVGVTGLINLFVYTTYDIILPTGIDYLQFQAWVMIWAAITHWLTAIFNVCDYTRFITDMTSETFGFYVGVIYIQKGVELLVLEFNGSTPAAGWLSVVVAILFALCAYYLEQVGGKTFGPFWLRKIFTDYAFAATIIFFTGFVHINGEITAAGVRLLPITGAFQPSTPRPWLIEFWKLPVQWVFAALPFGCLVTLLFYFDNNVSSVMAQSRSFPVKRPAGFHWDFFLLGCTTFVSGILGLPPPNGLVPQAPSNTESLSVLEVVVDDEDNGALGYKKVARIVKTRVVEQRLSHFLMGLLILGTMSGPLLVVLGLMSRAMFAGVFLVVGWGSVEGNGIVDKTLFLLRDVRFIPSDHPLRGIRRSSILRFISIQWLFFVAIVAVSETIAAICFPVVITILIPVRHFLVPRWFTAEELLVLDAPTANSAAVLVSLGGPLDEPVVAEDKLDVESRTSAREESGSLKRRAEKAL